jgi:ATP/maltotriose-dependent transcriptional regulator MalT
MSAMVAIDCGIGWDDAEARLKLLHDRACHAGDDVVASWMEMLLGWAALERGQVATARRWLREAASALQHSDPRQQLPSCLALLAVAEAAAGRRGEAQATLSRAVTARGPRPIDWFGGVTVAKAQIWTAAAVGETSRAVRLALEHARSNGHAPLSAGQFLHEALRVGGAAALIAAQLRRAADRTDSCVLQAGAAHAEALAEGDAAGLERAARAFANIGALLRAAEAAADAAEAYERAGRAASARAAASYSAALAARCEDARTPRLRGPRPVSLSRRELEVANLAARGMSNAEIAERLTVSVRTVESHLYRAATRLGISRREDFGPLLGIRPDANLP